MFTRRTFPRTSWTLVLSILVTLGLQACGNIPDSSQYLNSWHYYRRPRFANAQGPLTRAQGREIVARLEQRTGETDILTRHLAFEQAIVGTMLRVGNKVTLLENGPDTYRAMFASIESARDSINLETYMFSDDEIGAKFADTLIAKQRQGIQVNVIYDGFGSLYTPESFFHRMRESGIRVLQFNPLRPTARRFHLTSANHRDHRKLLVIDGRIAFLGGINISEVYSSGVRKEEKAEKAADAGVGWRDTDIEIEGPAVSECQKLFLATWTSQKGRPLSQQDYFPPLQKRGNEIVHMIDSAPEQPSPIYVTLISAINNAESNVYITDAYFAPDSQMLDAMDEAARRGVDVRLLVPFKADEPFVSAAARSRYSRLLAAGVKIYEWPGPMLHAKTVTVDHVWSMVGSSNLDWWSIARNNEIVAVVLSSGFGKQMDAMFSRDIASSTQVDAAGWKSRGVLERIRETAARVFYPLL